MTVNIIHQIDDVITQYREARKISEYDDCSDLPYEKQTLLLNLLSSTVQQLSPPGSQRVRLDETSGLGGRLLTMGDSLLFIIYILIERSVWLSLRP